MTQLSRRICVLVLGASLLVGYSPISLAAKQKSKPPEVSVIQGFSQDRLRRIVPVMQDQINKNMFPGAVTLVARNGQIVHFEATGYLDAQKKTPIQKDSIFRLASMTKPVVTAAAMMLVEQGKLKLNDPITTWLPELKDLKVETAAGDVPLNRPIWVQDLMRHTAGFVYAGSTRSPRIKKLYDDLNIESREVDITSEEMLKSLGQIPLAHQPGTFWEYSIAVDVLGLLLERVEKKPLDTLVKELLINPLGMKDTTWWVASNNMGRLAESLDSDGQKAAMLKSYRQSYDPSVKATLKEVQDLLGRLPITYGLPR